MAFLNRKCKSCSCNFHFCSSCDFYALLYEKPWLHKDFCSKACAEKSGIRYKETPPAYQWDVATYEEIEQ